MAPALFMLGAGVAASLALVWAGFKFQDNRALAGKLDELNAAHAAASWRPAPLTALETKQILALNLYIDGLNLPWDRVFQTIKPLKESGVYLLDLDAEPSTGKLRIGAVTDDATAIAGYVSQLSSQRQIADVYLVAHESQKDGSIQFEVEARWLP
ncbi:hypothetical protein AB4851_30175 [Burkholderia sp. 22PA0099]|uniref:hypothetical protein n=1 Tax=Burkholderia sp. 22PA0099 TaxID=3237372 RepID=UPI0039C3B3DB